MRTNLNLLQTRSYCVLALGIGSFFGLAAATENSADTPPATTAIPWSQLGAKAGADYQGDALAVIPIAEGARLRCAFQRLEGEATPEGLWLTSTVTTTENDRFRLVAVEVGRDTPSTLRSTATEDRCAPSAVGGATDRSANLQPSASGIPLSAIGTVSIDGQSVRFTRPGLVEEYTASMDGVRQDFMVLERPPGLGELVLRLAVSGARVESAAFGTEVVLANSGRKIAYGRLRVTDAKGQELTARLQVASDMPASARLAVVVNDAAAVYPVRVDPTFSDANWSSMGGMAGTDRSISAAVVDGLGNLYIGGWFTIAGEVSANHIAKWNGSSWSALGSGLDGGDNPYVSALAVSGSDLYVGGRFTTAGGNLATNVAKWNGSSWSALGSGIDNVSGQSTEVYALAMSGSDLYVGGRFTRAGGNEAKRIAKWDGSSWSALGSGLGGSFPYVSALAVSGHDVYVGGDFTSAGGSTAKYIAKWDGSTWSALGSGMNSGVLALAVSGSDVYAGGRFSTAGGSTANSIARWNGSAWTALDVGIAGGVFALSVAGHDVYAGGEFTTADGNPGNYIAKWDGNTWSALGSGVGDEFNGVYALAVSDGDVYAGGWFRNAGGVAAKSIAKWNGSSWAGLGSGMGGGLFDYAGVSALAVSGSDLYVGGAFTRADGSAAKNIAKWDGTSWAALGSGIGGGYPYVSALAMSGSDLYAGGWFTTAGGSAATNIAKWDGSSWSALGSGLEGGGVTELAVSGSNVYVGGNFTIAGGSTAKHVAKWDGSSWSALGSGMSGGDPTGVFALAVSGGDLYAGGWFTTAGGSAATNIAKWDGSSWSALGSGMGGVRDSAMHVSALAVSGGDLYAGGWFTTAGGSPASHIAKWDGSSWSALGSGIAESRGSLVVVSALVVSGGDLYADGYFDMAGGVAATNIAKWDGSSWSALGSGIGPYVSALAVLGSDLYAGGTFTTAGGKGSAYITRAYLPALPTLSVLRSGENVTVSWPTIDTAGFTLEQAGALAAPAGWVTNSATVTDGGANKSVTLPATNSPQFFRLRRS